VAAALLCGVGDVLLILSSDHFADPGVWAVFGPLIGGSFVGTGLYAWRRRPESRFGLLMTLTGFAWFLGPLTAADAPLVFTLGIVLGVRGGRRDRLQRDDVARFYRALLRGHLPDC
jgi:hypothetical protein